MHIYLWSAIGFDPADRFPGEIRMYFEYDATQWEAILVLQQVLGYQPDISDVFPLFADIPDSTPADDPEQNFCTLDKSLRVRDAEGKEKVIPTGTPVTLEAKGQFLFSPK